jgi:hypothetical protein
MLTPMTDDLMRRQTARDRIEERYRTPQERNEIAVGGHTDPLPVHEVLLRVLSTAENPTNVVRDQGPADPDGEDILAALALVVEAREQLEDFEVRLIRQAREREITWTDIAVPLGLRTRQSAESRAMRLERAAATGHTSRDVAATRNQKAGERRTRAWATAQEERLRAIAEQAVDTSPAWPDPMERDLPHTFAAVLQTLAAQLTSGAPGPALWDTLAALCWFLVPLDGRAPQPAGEHARAAKAVARQLSELRLLASRARDNQ